VNWPIKSLLILTDSYPFGKGELFLDTEVDILSQSFETIYILSAIADRQIQRSTPSNVIIIEYSSISLSGKMSYLWNAFMSPILWKEFFSIKSRFHHFPSLIHLKILLVDYIQASHLANTLESFCASKSLDMSSILFYSYWHDVKALSLCMLKSRLPIKAIARGHGWDIDYKRHNPSYLPFKNYIVTQLDKSVSISLFGERMLKEMSDPKVHSNIITRYLGKNNACTPMESQDKRAFLICSCSSLIPLKRVDRIVKVLSRLRIGLVHWVHFGAGSLETEIESMAVKYEVSHEFKGDVANAEILQYYSKNYVDLFINLSSSEGIPVSIMEAQSAGIPVLALDVGGCSEIVNNENGILMNKNSTTTDLVEAISSYLSSDKESQSKKRMLSYQNWSEKFNAEKNYKLFAEELLSL
jgi:glycosyltransferase involved in cell wall biosynthesis